jgi:hypothetical protein
MAAPALMWTRVRACVVDADRSSRPNRQSMSRKQRAKMTGLDLAGMLAVLTGTRALDWEFQEGPESRCGVDFYLRHSQGRETYINIDQGHFTVSVAGGIAFSGDPAEHPRLRRFISERARRRR